VREGQRWLGQERSGEPSSAQRTFGQSEMAFNKSQVTVEGEQAIKALGVILVGLDPQVGGMQAVD